MANHDVHTPECNFNEISKLKYTLPYTSNSKNG